MKLSQLHEAIIKGKSYGASYDAGEDDKPEAAPAGEKRGRGRPSKASQSMAAGGDKGKSLQDILVGKVHSNLKTKGRVFKMKEEVELDEAKKEKHPDSVQMSWSTGKQAYAKTHSGKTYRLNSKALMGKIPHTGDIIQPKQHHQIGEEVIDEMAMGSKKNSAGKKVEWINHPGLGHSVTVDGEPVHKGFVDHKTAAGLYAKHLGESVDEGVLQKMGLAADNETAKDVLKGIGKETVAGIKEVPSNLVKGAKHTLRVLRNPVKAADAAYDKDNK